MSFDGQSIATLAQAFAKTASGNNELLQVPMLNLALTRFQRDLRAADRTLSLTTASTPALAPNTQDYVFTTVDSVDLTMSVMYRQSSTENWRPLVEGSKEESFDYDQQSGEPRFFCWYRPSGVQTFHIYPKPTAAFAVAGAELRIFCRAKQAAVALLTDTIYLEEAAKLPLVYTLAAFFALHDGNEALFQQMTAFAGAEAKALAREYLLTYKAQDFDTDPLVSGRKSVRRAL